MNKMSNIGKIKSSQWQNLYRMLIAISFLNIGDLASTYWLCSLFSVSLEGNPVMRWFFTRGPNLAAIIKLSMLLLFLIIIPLSARRCFRLAYLGVMLVTLAYTMVLLIHILTIYRCLG